VQQQPCTLPNTEQIRAMQAVNFIFDVEGTLVDCVPQVLNCWLVVLANWRLTVAPDKLAGCSGMDPNDMLAQLLPAVGEKERKAIIAQHAAEYRANFLPSTRAFPGVRELLVEVKSQNHRIALATTCDATELAHYRQLMNVDDLIDTMACGEDVQRGKPHPDLINLTLEHVGRGKALVIGDTPYDALAARAAGTEPIGLLSGGFSETALRNAGCTEVFAVLHDLREALRRKSLPLPAAQS
jgi:HAD superfamily hydrolase (TIGR01549 family)